MMPRLLDLYCCQGGAGEGYRRAGFDVFGVDIVPQPRNPHPFKVGSAIDMLGQMLEDPAGFQQSYGRFDAVHASPPCQRYSNTQRIRSNDHPDLIGPTRELLIETGLPYVIENVVGARGELRNPVELCGAMFGLRTYRHRLFETNWPLTVPLHPEHTVRQTKMGRRVQPGEFGQFVGNFTDPALAREVMGMPWANREGLREAVPPAYTSYIGGQLIEYLTAAAELAA